MKAKDASNWFIAILSVGVLLSILFVFKFRNASSKTRINPTSAPPIVNTEGWKTVVFSRYKFSLKLPPGWSISNDSLNGKKIQLANLVTVVDDPRNLIHFYNKGQTLFSLDISRNSLKGLTIYQNSDPDINKIISTFSWSK